MRKLELFENQNFDKDIYKMGFEKTYLKSHKKRSKNVAWPKGGHATHAAGDLESFGLTHSLLSLSPPLYRVPILEGISVTGSITILIMLRCVNVAPTWRLLVACSFHHFCWG